MDVLVQVGLLILAFLLGALLAEPISNLRKSSIEKWKIRKEQKRLFAEAFERFVTDMEGLLGDRVTGSIVLRLHSIQRFHTALSEAKPYIKKSIHDISLEAINRAKEDCARNKIDVAYLKGQYEKTMKKKHPSNIRQTPS
jgi:hypothetical protein